MGFSRRTRIALGFVALGACVAVAGRAANLFSGAHGGDRKAPVILASASVAFADRLPAHVLWAWEEPEDLRFLDPEKTGVAYLAETLRLSDRVEVRARKQPLMVAPGTRVMAVVRVEAGREFRDTPERRRETAARIAAVAGPAVVAVQVDFDAKASQRAFYADVLRQLRATLPAGMPLSMTALLSWCSGDDWIANLPVDEAVPMYFRLGMEARDPLAAGAGAWRVVEPKCRGSVGVSTDEAWPAMVAGERIYIFAPHPWKLRDFANAEGLEALAMKKASSGTNGAMASNGER
jgi:hypothetical protein